MDNHKNTAQLKQLCYNEKTRNERFFFKLDSTRFKNKNYTATQLTKTA